MIEVNTIFNKELSDSVRSEGNKTLFKIVAFVLLALVFLFVVKNGSETDAFLKTLSSVSFYIVLTMFIILIFSIIFLKITEKKAQNSNPLLLQSPSINYKFYDTYFEVNVTQGEERIEYSKIEYNRLLKLIETKEYFLLYITGIFAHSIPKKNVPMEEYENLKNLLMSNIKNCKMLKR